MSLPDLIGAVQPRIALYLPHRPHGMEELVMAPSARTLVAANSNHWRKIVTLLAKVASPEADDWRRFRDEELFQQTALCFAPQLIKSLCWHWIGGKENLQRFGHLQHSAVPLAGCQEILIDPDKRLLLTPYLDYRQLSNALVSEIRSALSAHGFYCG
ncbi:DUF6942 family protein [Microbulbifer hainanensis]|uniref:DUF6942 family protein n=1 Tax=Microbulbifer hainanensis TaxID=2735675 RepID=UPI001865CB8E|nr:hypothetical protein [Microbulbifer hainanensis]